MKKSGSAGVGPKPMTSAGDNVGGQNGPLHSIPGLWKELTDSKPAARTTGRGSEAQRRLNLEQYMF